MAKWLIFSRQLPRRLSRRGWILVASGAFLSVVGMVGDRAGRALGATPGNSVGTNLVGTWEGKAAFHVPTSEPGAARGGYSNEPVTVRIRIAPDGTVEGQVGTARLVGCKLKPNRGWCGRMLHLATDYIICDGWVEGPVVAADPKTAKRSFTLPFNEEGGTLQGGLMVLQKGAYPFPMLPRLRLAKQPEGNGPGQTQ